jgi:hypothetical protein
VALDLKKQAERVAGIVIVVGDEYSKL